MATADWLFGGSTPSAYLTPSFSSTTTPDWLQAAQQALIGKASSYLNASQPTYQGPRIAGFTDDQTKAQADIRADQGKYDSAYSGAVATGQQVSQGFDADQFKKYLNPGLDNYVNSIGTYANRNLTEKLLPAVGNAFTRAGQFGSEGQQDYMSRAVRDTQEAVTQEQSKALADANQQALTAYNTGQNTRLTAANGAVTAANAGQTAGYNDANALYQSGANQQNLTQQNLTQGYQDFLDQKNAPWTDIQRLQSILQGTTTGSSTTSYQAKDYTTGNNTSGLGSILTTLGVGNTAAKAKGGMFEYAAGGIVHPGVVNQGIPADEVAQRQAALNQMVAELDASRLPMPGPNPVQTSVAAAPNANAFRIPQVSQADILGPNVAAPQAAPNVNLNANSMGQFGLSPELQARLAKRSAAADQALDVLNQIGSGAADKEQATQQARTDGADQIQQNDQNFMNQQTQQQPFLAGDYHGSSDPDAAMKFADILGRNPANRGLSEALAGLFVNDSSQLGQRKSFQDQARDLLDKDVVNHVNAAQANSKDSVDAAEKAAQYGSYGLTGTSLTGGKPTQEQVALSQFQAADAAHTAAKNAFAEDPSDTNKAALIQTQQRVDLAREVMTGAGIKDPTETGRVKAVQKLQGDYSAMTAKAGATSDASQQILNLLDRPDVAGNFSKVNKSGNILGLRTALQGPEQTKFDTAAEQILNEFTMASIKDLKPVSDSDRQFASKGFYSLQDMKSMNDVSTLRDSLKTTQLLAQVKDYQGLLGTKVIEALGTDAVPARVQSAIARAAFSKDEQLSLRNADGTLKDPSEFRQELDGLLDKKASEIVGNLYQSKASDTEMRATHGQSTGASKKTNIPHGWTVEAE